MTIPTRARCRPSSGRHRDSSPLPISGRASSTKIDPPACPPLITTCDFLVNNEGYRPPTTRRLPYADYGLVLVSAVPAGPGPQTLQTASSGANQLGQLAGAFVFLDPGGTNEKYVRAIGDDPENPSFQAIVTKDHAVGERIRPTIWPAPVLYEGDDLAFDILVASPDPGSDLAVVVQT